MKIFGLVGYPLSHSFSPFIFQKIFEREKITGCVYQLFELKELNGIRDFLIQHSEIAGLNITIPYKQQIIDFLDEKDEIAEQTGAVNTVKIFRQGKIIYLKGYNTDVTGFEQSLRDFVPPDISHALILGNGGAAKAVQYVFKKMNINYLIISRKKTENSLRYTDLNKDIFDKYHLIINCTPLGMFPNRDSFPEIPYHFLNKRHFLFDMVYNPEETLFLLKGKKMGCQTMNGMKMLEKQAFESFRIWFGI